MAKFPPAVRDLPLCIGFPCCTIDKPYKLLFSHFFSYYPTILFCGNYLPKVLEKGGELGSLTVAVIS